MTIHAQFDAHTGILPCCHKHYLELFASGHGMSDETDLGLSSIALELGLVAL